MNTETRLSIIESRDGWIRSIVKSSIGWTLLLTAAFVGAVFAVNSQFNSLESKFDRKIDALQVTQNTILQRITLQDLILQEIAPRPENQDKQ